MIIFLFCAVLMHILLKSTITGFNIYMIGSNPTASFFSGVDNAGVLMKTYILSGLYSGIASMIMISRFNSAKAGYGESYLLITILAAVLGGTSTSGVRP